MAIHLRTEASSKQQPSLQSQSSAVSAMATTTYTCFDLECFELDDLVADKWNKPAGCQ